MTLQLILNVWRHNLITRISPIRFDPENGKLERKFNHLQSTVHTKALHWSTKAGKGMLSGLDFPYSYNKSNHMLPFHGSVVQLTQQVVAKSCDIYRKIQKLLIYITLRIKYKLWCS